MFGLDREAAQQLLLFLMVWSLFAGLGITLGKKKGVSPAMAILGSFPLWVAIFAFWLVRQPDINRD